MEQRELNSLPTREGPLQQWIPVAAQSVWILDPLNSRLVEELGETPLGPAYHRAGTYWDGDSHYR
jgi:hypothetical protein